MLAQVLQGPVKKFTSPHQLPCQQANWVLLAPAVESGLFGSLALKSGPMILAKRSKAWINAWAEMLERAPLLETEATRGPCAQASPRLLGEPVMKKSPA